MTVESSFSSVNFASTHFFLRGLHNGRRSRRFRDSINRSMAILPHDHAHLVRYERFRSTVAVMIIQD